MPPLVMMYVASFSGMSRTLLVDAVAFGNDVLTWRVLNLCNSLLAPTFAKQYSSSGSMREYVAADWLAAVARSKDCAASWIALDLVGHENGYVELWT